MRFYAFGNMYLAGIHAGIQTAHTVHEMFVKYNSVDDDDLKKRILFSWAEDHKTTVVLNGGMQSNLEELYNFFNSPANPYPFAKFHEADFSLNGALTNVGIILPEKIYEAAKALRKDSSHDISHFSEFEKELVFKINACSLMN